MFLASVTVLFQCNGRSENTALSLQTMQVSSRRAYVPACSRASMGQSIHVHMGVKHGRS